MNMARNIVCISLVLLFACQHTQAEPALRIPRDNDHALLQAGISSLLPAANVILADDAFLDSPEVLIERRQTTGRSNETPQRIRLWIEAGVCLLEHVETASRIAVAGLSCQPVSSNTDPG